MQQQLQSQKQLQNLSQCHLKGFSATQVLLGFVSGPAFVSVSVLGTNSASLFLTDHSRCFFKSY